MPETTGFVVNDRRKFTAEGELRHEDSTDTSASPNNAPSAQGSSQPDAEERQGPQLVPGSAGPAEPSEARTSGVSGESTGNSSFGDGGDDFGDHDTLQAGPTDEETAEATRAYDATVERLDTAMRAADPGGERVPEMSFERLTQSLYTQALLLLGGGTQPGETPRVDILGARQTIDMLAVLADKTKGNLSPDEERLLQSALFDLRMGFLEITQALARQAAQRQGAGPGAGLGFPPAGAGPRIVR